MSEEPETILDALPDAVIGVDGEGIVRLANRQAEHLFGWERTELLGQPVEVLVPGAARAGHPSHRGRYAAAPRTRPMGAGLELSGLRRDGSEFPAEISLSNVERGDGSRLVVAAVRDVTERRSVERERDALRRVQAERLESLGQLAGGVAHDFNNLLAVITAYARFARDAVAGDERPELVHDLDEISKAAARAQTLTRQLLAFGRRETVQPRVLDLNAVVFDLLRLLGRALGEHVELTTSLAADLWPTVADPGQIEQVLVNLAVNARDAMPDGGRLMVQTHNAELEPGTVVGQGEVTQVQHVALTVRDTGKGIPPEVLGRIFEPFFTTKPKGEGTGLGLATVYGIVRQAGGFVDVASREGTGTTFTVYLPASEQPLPAKQERPGRDGAGGTGEVVLVVEDEPAVREVTRRMLDQHGFDVRTAGSPAEALDVLGSEDQVDLLLTDVVMPKMLGPELAEHARTLRPDLPVLFVSGYSYDAMVDEGRAPEGMVVLEKPIAQDKLVEAVRSMVHARR